MTDGQPAPIFGTPIDASGDADDIFNQGLEAADSPDDTPVAPVETPAEIPETALDQAPAEVVTPVVTPPAEAVEIPTDAELVDGQTDGQTEAEKLFAGKYKTAEDLEQGYRESSREAQQWRTRAGQAEQQHAQLIAAVQAWEAEQAAKPQAAPVEPQGLADPTDAQLTAWGIDRATFNALKPVIEFGIESRVAPMQEQQQAQTQAQQQAWDRQQQIAAAQAQEADASRVLNEFYTAVPEYAPDTEGHGRMVQLIERWNGSWTGDPSGAAPGSFNVRDSESLKIAAEADKRPMLAAVLEANPSYIDTDAGMEMARELAVLREARQNAATRQGAGKPAQALPQVESGASGQGARPLDTTPRSPIEEMVAEGLAQQSKDVFSRG